MTGGTGSLLETLAAVKRDPLRYLSARRLDCLATLLSGRDVALASVAGAAGLAGEPSLDALVEKRYGMAIMPWRSWVDVVEHFARDEWDAFERFLDWAATWTATIGDAPTGLSLDYGFGERALMDGPGGRCCAST